MTQEKWQELRNKIYAVAAIIATLLITLGIIDKTQSDEAVNILNLVLELLGQGILLYGAILAWWKTLSSRTTTIEIPSDEVHSVLKTDGNIIAGPANTVETGNVLTPKVS